MKVISWNLLRLIGAKVEDVADLVRREKPDILLVQEATKEIEHLPALVGGHFHRAPLPTRIHGLGAWTPNTLHAPQVIQLPMSNLPGRLPPRVAQIVKVDAITFANVHLSHGQLLNRRQLAHAAAAIEGPAALIGDFNAVGPIFLRGFRDVGPREITHEVKGRIARFRLDRCLVRDLECARTWALDRGPSDHRPIVLELSCKAG